MGLLTRLFGQVGTARIEGELEDGRTFSGKVEIETIGNTLAEVEAHLKNALFVEKGWRVRRVEVVGFVER